MSEEEPECIRCGDCCRKVAINIPISEQDKNLLEKGETPPQLANDTFFFSLHENVDAGIMELNGEPVLHIQIYEKCSMLQEHRDGTASCKIYNMRPMQCRNFPHQRSYKKKQKDFPKCPIIESRIEQNEDEIHK